MVRKILKGLFVAAAIAATPVAVIPPVAGFYQAHGQNDYNYRDSRFWRYVGDNTEYNYFMAERMIRNVNKFFSGFLWEGAHPRMDAPRSPNCQPN